MDLLETAEIDYGTYKVVIKPAVKSKKFQAKTAMITTKYARREKMIEDGLVDKVFAQKVEDEKAADIADLYISEIIVSLVDSGGKAVEDLKSFIIDPVNVLMMGDILEQATIESNFIAEHEESEIKNSPAS